MPKSAMLRKRLPEVLSSVVAASARLSLHLTGAAVLSAPEVQRLTQILTLFLEAIDDATLPPPDLR